MAGALLPSLEPRDTRARCETLLSLAQHMLQAVHAQREAFDQSGQTTGLPLHCRIRITMGSLPLSLSPSLESTLSTLALATHHSVLDLNYERSHLKMTNTNLPA